MQDAEQVFGPMGTLKCVSPIHNRKRWCLKDSGLLILHRNERVNRRWIGYDNFS